MYSVGGMEKSMIFSTNSDEDVGVEGAGGLRVGGC